MHIAYKNGWKVEFNVLAVLASYHQLKVANDFGFFSVIIIKMITFFY
jgi:hypothetical protein